MAIPDISFHKINDLRDVSGKEKSAGKQEAGSFQHLFNQAVSAGNPKEIQDLVSQAAQKCIQDLVDSQIIDIMGDDYENNSSSIFNLPFPCVPQMASKNHDLSESSKIQHTVSENDVISSKNTLDTIIDKAAKIHDVDSDLIKSVIRVESNFKPGSVSSAGAMGLMQLMPETAKELGVKNAYDPAENIMGGTKYLKGLLDRYGGNKSLALAAYNWGLGNVEKDLSKMPQETRNYIGKVMKYYRDAKA